jgi:hypothetical protein
MQIDLTTPALLFPAISLLLLAYTNRFLSLAALIRALHDRYRSSPDEMIHRQIRDLRRRVVLIRNMQAWGAMSLLFCVACMLVLFAGQEPLAKVLFGLSPLMMIASLAVSVREIQISIGALDLQLQDIELPSPRSGAEEAG